MADWRSLVRSSMKEATGLEDSEVVVLKVLWPIREVLRVRMSVLGRVELVGVLEGW